MPQHMQTRAVQSVPDFTYLYMHGEAPPLDMQRFHDADSSVTHCTIIVLYDHDITDTRPDRTRARCSLHEIL